MLSDKELRKELAALAACEEETVEGSVKLVTAMTDPGWKVSTYEEHEEKLRVPVIYEQTEVEMVLLND